MPKGVYQPSRLYRNTSKLTEALGALKYHDPNFKPEPEMTNDYIYERLKEFGFTYRGGQWRLPLRGNRSNGHIGTNVLPEKEVTIKPIDANRLEMCIGEGQLEGLQAVIDAMHTLGFKVDVKIVGTK